MNQAFVLLFCVLSAFSVHAAPNQYDGNFIQFPMPDDGNEYKCVSSDSQLNEFGIPIITLKLVPIGQSYNFENANSNALASSGVNEEYGGQFTDKNGNAYFKSASSSEAKSESDSSVVSFNSKQGDQSGQSYNFENANSNALASSGVNEEYGGQFTDKNGNAYFKSASSSEAKSESDSSVVSFSSENEDQSSLSGQSYNNYADSKSAEETSNEYVGSSMNKNNAYYKASSSSKAESENAYNEFSYNSGFQNGNKPHESKPTLQVLPPKSNKRSPFFPPISYPPFYPPTPYIPSSNYPTPVIPYHHPGYVPHSENYPGYPVYPHYDDYTYGSPNEYPGRPYHIPVYPPHPKRIPNTKPRLPKPPITSSQSGVGAGAYAGHPKNSHPVGPQRGPPKRPQNPGSNGPQYGIGSGPKLQQDVPQDKEPQESSPPPSSSQIQTGSPGLPTGAQLSQQATDSPTSSGSSTTSQSEGGSVAYGSTDGNGRNELGSYSQSGSQSNSSTSSPTPQQGVSQPDSSPSTNNSQPKPGSPGQPTGAQQQPPPATGSPILPGLSSYSQADGDSYSYINTDGNGRNYLGTSSTTGSLSNSSISPTPQQGVSQPDSSPSTNNSQPKPGSPGQPTGAQQQPPPATGSPILPGLSSYSQADGDSYSYINTDGNGRNYLGTSSTSGSLSNSSISPTPQQGVSQPDSSPSTNNSQPKPGSPGQPTGAQQQPPPATGSPILPGLSSYSQADGDSYSYINTDGNGRNYLGTSSTTGSLSNSSISPTPQQGVSQPDSSPSTNNSQPKPGSPGQPTGAQQQPPPATGSPILPGLSSYSQADGDSYSYINTDGNGRNYLGTSSTTGSLSNSSISPTPQQGVSQPDSSPSTNNSQPKPGSPGQPTGAQQQPPPATGSPILPGLSSYSQADGDSYSYINTDGNGRNYLGTSSTTGSLSNSSISPTPQQGVSQPDSSPSTNNSQPKPGSPGQPTGAQQQPPPATGSPILPGLSSYSQADGDSYSYINTDGNGRNYLGTSSTTGSLSNSSISPTPQQGVSQPDSSPSTNNSQPKPGSPGQPTGAQQQPPPATGSPILPGLSSYSQADGDSYSYINTDGNGRNYLGTSSTTGSLSNSSISPTPQQGVSQPDSSPSTNNSQPKPGSPGQPTGAQQQPPPATGSPILPGLSSYSQADGDSYSYINTDGNGRNYLGTSSTTGSLSNSSISPTPQQGVSQPDSSPSTNNSQPKPGSPGQPTGAQQQPPPATGSPILPGLSSYSQADGDSYSYINTDGNGRNYLGTSSTTGSLSNSSISPTPQQGVSQPDSSPSTNNSQPKPGSPGQPTGAQQQPPPATGSPILPGLSSYSQADGDSYSYINTDGNGRNYLGTSSTTGSLSNSSISPTPQQGVSQPDSSPSTNNSQPKPGSPGQPTGAQQQPPPATGSPILPGLSSYSQADGDSYSYINTDGNGRNYLGTSSTTGSLSNSSISPTPQQGVSQPDSSPSTNNSQPKPGSPGQPTGAQQQPPPATGSPILPGLSSYSQADGDSYSYINTDGNGRNYLGTSSTTGSLSNSSISPTPQQGVSQPDSSPSTNNSQPKPGSPGQPTGAQQQPPPATGSPILPGLSSYSQADGDSYSYINTDGNGRNYLGTSSTSGSLSNSSISPTPQQGVSQPDSSPSTNNSQPKPGSPGQPTGAQQQPPPATGSPILPGLSSYSQADGDSYSYINTDGNGRNYLGTSSTTGSLSNSSISPRPGSPQKQQPGNIPSTGSPKPQCKPKKPCGTAPKPGVGSGLVPGPEYPKYPPKTRTCICFNSYSEIPAVLRNQLKFY